MSNQQRLGYLSAGPRVSTRQTAEMGGPRSHVIGIIKGFQAQGWEVKQFIVGDRLPSTLSGKGSEAQLTQSQFKTFLADLVRIAIGAINARQAWRELGDRVDWAYERFAAFQSLGWIFQETWYSLDTRNKCTPIFRIETAAKNDRPQQNSSISRITSLPTV